MRFVDMLKWRSWCCAVITTDRRLD